jgi:cytochrome P450
MHVIADIVGIPEADRPEVFRLTDLIMRATDPFQEIGGEERRNAEAALFTYDNLAQQCASRRRSAQRRTRTLEHAPLPVNQCKLPCSTTLFICRE